MKKTKGNIMSSIKGAKSLDYVEAQLQWNAQPSISLPPSTDLDLRAFDNGTKLFKALHSSLEQLREQISRITPDNSPRVQAVYEAQLKPAQSETPLELKSPPAQPVNPSPSPTRLYYEDYYGSGSDDEIESNGSDVECELPNFHKLSPGEFAITLQQLARRDKWNEVLLAFKTGKTVPKPTFNILLDHARSDSLETFTRLLQVKNQPVDYTKLLDLIRKRISRGVYDALVETGHYAKMSEEHRRLLDSFHARRRC